jgi:hypothetical protein
MEVIIANFDDWQGIYVDGELKSEGHSLYYRDVLDAIKLEYKLIEVDMLELDLGRYPETLEELKELVEENE